MTPSDNPGRRRAASPERPLRPVAVPGDVHVAPLTPARWADLEALFGPGGACGGCWCMWWRRTRREFEAAKGDGNRRAFKAVVRAGPPPGLIAYRGGAPAGWCQVTPREVLPGLDRSPLLRRVDDVPVWAISCFFVKADHRGYGLTGALIAAAKAFARDNGAKVLEAYPWDARVRKSPSTIFTGWAATFARHGFRVVARRVSRRPIMRCALDTFAPPEDGGKGTHEGGPAGGALRRPLRGS
ncbi:MAG: GNAT family N-acetyltransferase [Alphaproteobacteria bacterium]|nr:MAG: GNAT family N-acetyltransferase [Alphaproteobacteria bacterium]